MINLSYLFENFQTNNANLCIGILETSSKFPNVKKQLMDKYGSVKTYGDSLQFFLLNNLRYYLGISYFYMGEKRFGDNSPASLLDNRGKMSSTDKFFKDISFNSSYCYKEDLGPQLYNKLQKSESFINLNVGDFGYISLFCFFEIGNLIIDKNGQSNIKVKKHLVKPLMFSFNEIKIYNDLNSDIQTIVDFQ